MTLDLTELEGRRRQLYQKLSDLGDFRRGSIVTSYRRCGKDNCICANPEHPGHGPQYLLTFKIGGKTQTKVLRPGPELEKVQNQVANHHIFQEITKELIDVNELICDLRPTQSANSDPMGDLDSMADVEAAAKKGASKKGSIQKSPRNSSPS